MPKMQSLFSQPRMVRDLLRGFVREDWLAWLDTRTLDPRPPTDAGPPLDRINETQVWRVLWQGGSTWFYLLVRHETQVDPLMALRMWLYRGLLYQDLVLRRETAPPARLPVVLPVVVYDGAPRWDAPLEALELFMPLPAALHHYPPRMRYHVLDVRHDAIPEAAGPDNLVTLLCKLERGEGTGAVEERLDRLLDLASGPDAAGLRRAWQALRAERGTVWRPVSSG